MYIDTVGYENCEWQAAPDDPCCTIPVCFNQSTVAGVSRPPLDIHAATTPLTDSVSQPPIEAVEAFCLSASNDVYSVGQSWNEGTACRPKSCRCLLRPNGTTVSECVGGCAAIPDAALRPTIVCPKPQLVTPEDACLCPYVVCSHRHNKIFPFPQLPGLASHAANPAPGAHNWTSRSDTVSRGDASRASDKSLQPATASSDNASSRFIPPHQPQPQPQPLPHPPSTYHPLRSDELRPFYIALAIMALFATTTSIAFFALLCILLRSKSSAKMPISRSLSDQAYDNPTYNACDSARAARIMA